MDTADGTSETGGHLSAPPWQLTDLISVEALQSIQDTFARAFGLPTVIIDTHGVNATAITHRVAFCEDLTRTSEVAGPRCAECDLCAMRDAGRTNRPAIFRCWNGLYDCAIPIAPKGHILGYFLCGQIFDEPPDPEAYAQTATDIGVDPDSYVQALGEVKVVPYEQYAGAVHSMHFLAGMIADQAAAAIDSLHVLEDARRAKEDAARLVEELDTILEALRDIGSQPDYQATLGAIADNLARLIPWDSCVIYLTDGEELVPVVVRDPYAELVAGHRPRKGRGVLGTAALGGPGRRYVDVTRDPEFEPIPGVPVEAESALVMPMTYKGTVSGVIMLSRFERRTFTDHELQVLDVFSSQASVSIQVAKLASDRVEMLEREQQLLLRYQRLAELGTELVNARDAAEVRERLLRRTPEILSADAAFIALVAGGPDAIAVELRRGAAVEQRTVKLQRGARLATVRLRDEPAPDPSVFETWSQEVFAAVAPDSQLRFVLAEPLPGAEGAFGGLFVAWRSDDVAPSPEQRRILRVLASAAATALARFAAHRATDSTLRDRLLELEALTGLAQRLSGLTREGPIVEQLLAALCRVGRLDGAVYGSFTASGPRVELTSGIGGDALSGLLEVLGRAERVLEGRRLDAGDGASEVLVIPMPGGDDGPVFVAGIGPRVADDQRDRVLATLARYGGVALENAHLHDRQREAISRLERQQVETAEQNAKLERVLSVHETLALAVLEGRGLDSVVRSLATFMKADMLVVAGERVLASDGRPIAWRPPATPEGPPRTIVTGAGGDTLVAAPALVGGETLAWAIARTSGPAGDVERAAVEYGALLVALELLRERTAVEVETRLRGGLLEELFSDAAVPDVVGRRALAFGYELDEPSRVFLVEGATTDLLFTPVAECARRWSARNLVAPRGGALVVVVPERPDGADDDERRFEDDLRDVVAQRLGHVTVNTAVGTRCEQAQDYRQSYLAARRGLDLLRLLGREGELFSFRLSNIESMLLQSTRPEVVLSFISRYVEPLERYDRSHTSDLLRTVEVFFECGGALEETARRLHVHVSTLRYRLGKATELLDVDLRDGAAALDVQVALRAARVLRVHRGG